METIRGISRDLPNVYEHDSYRTFLKALYSTGKARKSGFSFQVLSRQLGFRSKSHLQLVIVGKRNLARESVDKFSGVFGSRKKEFEHFKNLVFFENAPSPSEKSRLAREIIREKSKLKITAMRFEWYCLYSDWFYFPILFLASRRDFRDDTEWICSQLVFPITTGEVKAAKKKFFELGLWKRGADGKITVVEKMLHSYGEMDLDLLKNYHRKMLEMAVLSADFPRSERYLSGSTLWLSESEYADFCNDVANFKSELFHKYSNDSEQSHDKIYQFSVAAFPLTKAPNVLKPGGS